MYLEFIILCIAPIVGLLIGLLPAIGSFIMMISFYPLLIQIDPQITICFYAMMLTASQFSGSVAAIWFGILGEYTSIPIIRERKTIIHNNLEIITLHHTAYTSVISTVLTCIMLYIFVMISIDSTWILRTDVMLVFILIIFAFCIFWPHNSWYINIALICIGLLLGFIGYHPFSKIDFMTFNNVYLYNGLPTISVLLGLYAVPTLLNVKKNMITFDSFTFIIQKHDNKTHKFSFFACIRGTIVGFFSGLIPAIGTMISSNLAYLIEKRINKNTNEKTSLIKITSAEAANNSAAISVLLPLLMFGLPIQPSEIVLYEIITTNYWLVSSVTSTSLIFLCAMILITSLISYVMCWTFVKHLSLFFKTHYENLIYLVILAIIVNIAYIGFQGDQTIFYLFVFVVMLIFGLILIRYVDILPLLIAFMLQNQLLSVSVTFIEKYL